MAWHRPNLWRGVVAYSPSFINAQFPYNPATPLGNWDLHSGKEMIVNGLCGKHANEKVDETAKLRVMLFSNEYDLGWDCQESSHFNYPLACRRTASALIAA